MDAFVITLTKGCYANRADSEILGIFLSIEEANLHIKDDTVFGSDVEFTSGTQTINFGEKFSGCLSLSIHRQLLVDLTYEQKKLHDIMEWLDAEPKIWNTEYMRTKLVQHFPDTVGLEFSGYIVTLTDDGRWFIEANDGG